MLKYVIGFKQPYEKKGMEGVSRRSVFLQREEATG